MNIATKLERLSLRFGLDHDVEHCLHELCHVVTLNNYELIDDAGLEDNIGHSLRFMSHLKRDQNEISTIACELVVFNTHPSLGVHRDTVEAIVRRAQFACTSSKAAKRAVLRRVAGKTSKVRAAKVVKLIGDLCKEPS